MKHFRPIEKSYISQKWGESKACIYPNGKVVGKSRFSNTCPVGSVDFYKSIGMRFHNGVDIACPKRAIDYFDVQADTKWVAGYDNDYMGGLGIDVYSLSPIQLFNFSQIDGVGYEAMQYYKDKGWYNVKTDECRAYIKRRGWHYNQYIVKDGESVKIGQPIAYCGTTGASSNDHLHRGHKIVTEDRVTLGKNNGTYGAIDLSHLYDPTFVLDHLKKKAPKMTLSDHLYLVAWKFNGTQIERIFENLGLKYDKR